MSFSGDFSTVNPTSKFPSKGGETSRPSYIPNKPTQTNNFYTNWLLENHDQSVWTSPYKLTVDSKNFNVYYPVESDLVYGPDPVKYFFYPNGTNHVSFGSSDFNNGSNFKITKANKFALTAQLSNVNGTLTLNLVQGMGLVTGVYDGLIPEVHSSVGFRAVDGKACQNPNLKKFEITLNNGVKYTMYANKSVRVKFNNDKIIFDKSYDGLYLQMAYGTFDYYDQVAGCFINDVELQTTKTSYTFNYKISGKSLTSALVFSPPHMVKNFNDNTKTKISNIKVNSHVLGQLTGCITNSITVNVKVPGTMFGFKTESFSDSINNDIRNQARHDCNNDVDRETNGDSMYFTGKKFLKYAYLLYIVHFVLKDSALTTNLLTKLKNAYKRFINNNQQNPLFYDTQFKGIVSSATKDNDFGNGHYNDHHFHYGYHVHASALIIHVEKDLGQNEFQKSVKDWIELLIMDVFNVNQNNSSFPFVRSFDFYYGHSWAKGLYVSADGKDEESSSEDYNCYYGMKLYGQATGNQNLVDCSNLVLGIMNQSFNNYFYYLNNTNIPSKFVGNIVSGIYFENKIDHTTYFGNYESYIHGIHMIPLTPLSSVFRSKDFVTYEWETLKGQLTQDNWMSTCMLNYSLIDGQKAYDFFKNQWQDKFLDDGLSLTYCLMYCASNK